jgi:hypothetical protein
MLIFPILPIIGTLKITQPVSDSNQHLFKCLFGLSGRQSRDFSMRHIVLLLLNRCLCVINSLCCPSSFSPKLILNPFLFLFVVSEVTFLWFLYHKLLFGSEPVQCPKGSVSSCLQAAVALIRMMMTLG